VINYVSKDTKLFAHLTHTKQFVLIAAITDEKQSLFLKKQKTIFFDI
jgi:hypothetical protein